MRKKDKETAEHINNQDNNAVGDENNSEAEMNNKDQKTKPGDKKEEKEVKDPVEQLNEELEQQKDKYIRLMAEFDNYKRRTSKEYERLVESANERLMLDIIEVRESFERALTVKVENKESITFIEGMKLIFTKLDENLKKNGLEVFTEVGDDFNPEIHDAMMKTPHDEIQEDHIVEIFEKGYKLKNHVIKHAKVIVSAGASSDTEDATGSSDEISEEAAAE